MFKSVFLRIHQKRLIGQGKKGVKLRIKDKKVRKTVKYEYEMAP